MPSFTFSSNSLRLKPREWVVLAVLLAAFFAVFPRAWSMAEHFTPGRDYRFPYEISNDYWMYDEWCARAAKTYPHLVLGDSVVWGQYAAADETLTHYLNALDGRQDFANIALDGIHPVATDGLVRYYGKAVANTKVLLNLNLLWMSSPEQDFQETEEFRFNHPRLVPQLVGRFDCYKPPLPELVSVALERHVDFFGCMRHIAINCFDNMTVDSWTLDHPYESPFSALRTPLPPGDVEPRSRPVDWQTRGMGQQTFDWVPLASSNQWRMFTRTVETLRSRGNSVFVLLVPINPYMQTDESLARYEVLSNDAKTWLERERLPFYCADGLGSLQYADASHPLADGYADIARELSEYPAFQDWMGK